MYKTIKRLIDILFSFFICLFFLPIMLFISLMLKFVGERRVFYFQDRVGKNKKTFKLIKFTTMFDTVENKKHAGITLDDDPDVFPFGRFLRKTKLNEIPQFINVLKGDMSLVGPRPLTWKSFSKDPQDIQTTISTIKPGVTGIGSVVFRNEEKIIAGSDKSRDSVYEEEILPYKGMLEKWYASNKSFLLDFKILFVTFLAVVFSKSCDPRRFFKNLPGKSNNAYSTEKLFISYIKKESFDILYDFVKSVDNNFHPPLSSRVNLKKYIKKLITEGYVVAAILENTETIEGVAAFYCTPEEYEYAFLSFIASRGKIKGVGSLLLQELIHFCKIKNVKGIETQTWETNHVSRALFEKYGFQFVKYLDNRKETQDRSVFLRLNFHE